MEIVLRCFQETDGPRSNIQQSNFKRDLIQAYNLRDPEDDEGLWCPIMQRFDINPLNRKASHLFPRALGQKATNQIFGPGAHEDLSGVRNGLVMSPLIEGNYDTHKLVIVPKRARTDSNAVDELVLRIVDHQIDNNPVHELSMTYKELDGRQLKFLSDARPAARYLYFQYVVPVYCGDVAREIEYSQSQGRRDRCSLQGNCLGYPRPIYPT